MQIERLPPPPRGEASWPGVMGLRFLGGSYYGGNIPVLRLETVSNVQIESGRVAIGLTRPAGYFPLAWCATGVQWWKCAGCVGANVMFMIKETSVFSAVALADLNVRCKRFNRSVITKLTKH